jgi:hypothetical protein
MRKIRYIGPNVEVQIAATGQIVKQNHQVEIEDDDLARSLLEQKSNWEKVTTKKEESNG